MGTKMRCSRLFTGKGLMIVIGVMAASPAVARRPRRPPAPVIDPAAVEEPKINEACFSPDEPCGVKLIKFVQGAQKSLDVAIYDINLDQLVHSLATQARKIPVRVVVDHRQSKGDHSLVGLLVKAGVNVRFGRQRGIMHNKFIIRDGTTMETGSFNFTNHAAIANNENQIYLDTPAILARYKARFEQVWADAEPATPEVGKSSSPVRAPIMPAAAIRDANATKESNAAQDHH